jgi:single-stranded-DNA-specific exonuclease
LTEWVSRKIKSDISALKVRGKTIPKIIVQILESRGYSTKDAVERYFAPRLTDLHDPFLLNDMEKAVDRLILAIQKKEKVLVHGDYDADGITACALVIRCLQTFGLKVEYYIPHRLEEGYGLSMNAINMAKKRKCSLIITVDCGTTALNEIAYAVETGIDVIITDHHKPKDVLPHTYALINPKLSQNSYPFSELAGVGVAYKLCAALYEKIGESQEVLKADLDLVALGTVVDVVPLIDENRILVKYGIHSMLKSNKPGIKALLRETNLTRGVSAYHLGFVIGPRINACGRVGDAQGALELFLTDNKSKAEMLAKQLSDHNRKRQEIEEQIYVKAEQKIEKEYQAQERVIVLGDSAWHEGIVGIVAARISDIYHRPSILLCLKEQTARGSARSIPGFDITEALHACRKTLIKYGGHSQAAGLELKVEDIDALRTSLNTHAQSYEELIFNKKRMYDTELAFNDITDELIYFLRYFEPTGTANPQPVFLSTGLEVVGIPRVVGSNHLKCALRGAGHVFDAIAYGHADKILNIEIGVTKVDCLYSIFENTFAGKKKAILKVKEMRIRDENS